jgi:hypothetical protein
MPYYLDDTIEPSEVYYNILIKNNITGFDKDANPIPIASSVPLVFDETRSIPYIYHPSKYYMSVLSFEMDTQSVPTFIVEPIPGCNKIEQTIYYVTVTDATDTVILPNGHQNIFWVPEDLSAPIPPSPVPDNFNEYPYYFGYTYSYFIELVNKAMATACVGHIPIINHPPVLQLENGIVSLVASAQSNSVRSFLTDEKGNCINLDGTPNPNGHKIFFNSELYYYFSSLKAFERNEPLNGVSLNANFQLILNINPSGTNYKKVYTNLLQTPLVAHYDAVVSTCEYPPIPFWNPIDSIVFTTNHLNVVPELIAANAVTGVSATSSSASNAEAYYILTDYAAPLYTGTEYKPNIFFQPQAEYRLSDLYGDNPVYQLVLNVYWKDKYGSLHTFMLESGGTASLKVLFRKKVFYLDF